MTRKTAYIIARYRADTPEEVLRNVEEARQLGAELLRMGYIPLIPQAMYHGLDGVLTEPEILDRLLVLLRMCDIGVVHENFRDSFGGCHIEINQASGDLQPLYYYPEDIDMLRAYVREPGEGI